MRADFNNTVYIVSDDAVFARMLELELLDAGVNARRADGIAQCAASLAVIDSETVLRYGGDRWELSADTRIEFGFGDTPALRCAAYFQRPFPMDDFVCRVKALLGYAEAKEKAPLFDGSEQDPTVAEKTGLVYDAVNNAFFYSGEPITLTETEHALLSLLYEKRGETVTREEILRRVWGRDGESDSKTNLTDVYIRYLRGKLDDRFSVKLILAVRGKGYVLKS